MQHRRETEDKSQPVSTPRACTRCCDGGGIRHSHKAWKRLLRSVFERFRRIDPVDVSERVYQFTKMDTGRLEQTPPAIPVQSMKTITSQLDIPTAASGAHPANIANRSQRIPLILKLSYTAFMAVLVPVYWTNYGPTNFLYFCDVALLLTLIGMWTEQRLLVSMSAVGILLPQTLWVVDFLGHFAGLLTGMTDYMFDANRSLFLRGLSFFHGWLPFLLLFLVAKLGYDRRAFWRWTILAWALCLLCFFALPPAGAVLPDPKLPVNINYVWGFSDAAPQSWMDPRVYLAVWMTALPAIAYLPVHALLSRWKGGREIQSPFGRN